MTSISSMPKRLRNNVILFLVIGASVVSCLGLIGARVYRAQLIRRYCVLYRRHFNAEAAALSVMRLELTDVPAGASSGNTGKFFLKDTAGGGTWIFKAHPVHLFPVLEERISRFFRVCGMDTPFLVTRTLPVNDKRYFGSLQRYIPSEAHPRSLREFDTSDARQMQYLLNTGVLAYLFDIRPDFIVSGGAVYAVDLDDIDILDLVFLYGYEDLAQTCLDEQCGVFMRYLGHRARTQRPSSENYDGFLKRYSSASSREAMPYHEETAKLIHFVAEIDDRDFLSFFRCPEFDGSGIYRSYLQSVLSRKKAIREHFSSAASGKRYSLAELRGKISALRSRVERLERGAPAAGPDQQRMLYARECPEARALVNMYSFGETDLSYNETLSALEALSGKSVNGLEKEAIDFYLRTLREKAGSQNTAH